MNEEILNQFYDIEDAVVIDGKFAHWCKKCGVLVRATKLSHHVDCTHLRMS